MVAIGRRNDLSGGVGGAWITWHSHRREYPNDADRSDPRLDIVGKADLKGLPPFTVVTAQIDPLHDDGKMLADKIKAAGGEVTYRDYPGVTHEFFGMGNVVAKAKQAEDAVVADLKKAFAGEATGTTAPRN